MNEKVLFVRCLSKIVLSRGVDDDLGQNPPIVDKGESILSENYVVILSNIVPDFFILNMKI